MTVFSAQQIKFEFLSYIKEFDLDPKAWRIGVADDARAALFAAHGVDETRDIWLWKPTLSAAAAGLVFDFFTQRFGVPAAEPGTATAGRCVFLFKRRGRPADSNLQGIDAMTGSRE